MLGALKAVYDMFKIACESYTTRKSADAEVIADLRKAREEIVKENKGLVKENKELLDEQTKAIAMIEEMADYLEKH